MKTTKTNQIGDWYKKFRGVGYPALQALREAKVMHEFKILENQGLVSLSKEHETESYFDVYGKPETKNQEREIRDMVENWGLWYVQSNVLNAAGEMENVDGIGMILCREPLSPFENCYIPDLAKSAIDAYYETLANVATI